MAVHRPFLRRTIAALLTVTALGATLTAGASEEGDRALLVMSFNLRYATTGDR